MNRLKDLRKKAGLTQAQLAKKAQTSQQQIQRLESGQAARLELALRVAKALDAPLEKAFPDAKAGAKRLRAARTVQEFWKAADDASEELAKGGLDADPRQWHLVLTLGSGAKRSYPITTVELDRVWAGLQSEAKADADRVPFIVFDSEDCRVAVDPSCVVHALACWDAPEPIVHFEHAELL
ncbi:MAG: helix-turn-helix transcriptional regulator [Myxococcales bacterium]